MATVRFARVDVTGLLKSLESTARSVGRARQDLQIEAARGGAEKMKEFIEQRGTGKNPWGYVSKKTGQFVATPMRAKESPRSGTLRSGSTPGRVNPGNMRDSVGFRFESGPERTISSFGWINASGQYQEYFLAQEYGFNAGGFRPNMSVPGMFALRDARLYVTKELLPRLIRKYQNRIARGRYQ
jgi:hypothetical protein